MTINKNLKNLNIGIQELGNLDYVVNNQVPSNLSIGVSLNLFKEDKLLTCEELVKIRQQRGDETVVVPEPTISVNDIPQQTAISGAQAIDNIISNSSVNENIVLKPVYGKKYFYVLAENVDDTRDLFRKFLKNYWEIKDNKLVINTGSISQKIVSIVTSSVTNNSDLFSTSTIRMRQSLSSSDYRTGSLFRDIVFETDYAFTGREIKFGQVNFNLTTQSAYIADQEDSSLVVSVENDYNFYIPSYEKLQADEKLLPNFYILLTNQVESDSTKNNLHESHKKLLTISGAINLQASNDEFYDLFSNSFSSANQEQKGYVSEKMKNIVFSKEDYKKFKEFQSYSTRSKREKTVQRGKKEQVPFYTKLEIDTEYFGPINKSFNDSGLIDILTSYIASSRSQETSAFFSQETTENGTNISKRDLYFKDIVSILEQVGTGSFSFNSSGVTYLGSLEKKIEDFESVDMRIQELISYSTLKNIHVNLKNTLNYINNLAGAKCYQETIFYKVDKQDTSGNIIQSFFIPNIEDVKSLSIIDSQIKYGKKYVYRIHAYKIIVGNEYIYDTPSDIQIAQDSFPRMYLISTEYCSVDSRISDKPPAPPEVDIIPFKDNDSELLFLLNTSAVEYELMPVFLNDKEKNDYNKIRESQQVLEGQKIKFGGEDRAKEFWIYRLESQPFSINEFEGKLYEKVSTKCAAASSFKDSLEPNKKYYYMFRALDVHNNLSNPSEIYEVELISENGMSFLKTNIVSFKKREFKKETKSLKRYLHIRPSLQQSSIDDSRLDQQSQGSQQIKKDVLGTAANSVWGQKYKIRVRSKNTNKFMDIYFTFKQVEKPQNPTNLKETCE